VAWVRQRTIPTERPPLIGEVSENFLRMKGATWSAWRIPTAYFWLSRPEPLLFLPSSSSIVLMRLSGPRSRPTISQKIWYRRKSNPDLWICSQELWPLDHRGGPNYYLRIFIIDVITLLIYKYIKMNSINKLSSTFLEMTCTAQKTTRQIILSCLMNSLPLESLYWTVV
jgi:hypothetical protein